MKRASYIKISAKAMFRKPECMFCKVPNVKFYNQWR